MRTHPLNIGYLVVGLVFLGLAGSWALSEAGVVEADGMQWALPVTLVLAGAAGLLASVLKAVRGGAREEPSAVTVDTGADDAGLFGSYRYDDPADVAPATVRTADSDEARTTIETATGPASDPATDPATQTAPDTGTAKDDDR